VGADGSLHLDPLLAVLSPALLLAVRINGKGREVLYLAKGDSVKLGCPYVLEPEDNGPQGVGIEWIQITPDQPAHSLHCLPQFLSYQDHHVNYGSGSGLQDRVAFVQNDPSQYDASIRLADLQVSDTGTYQCRVKKNTVAVHEVIVTVQEKPAIPQCWTEGELIEGSSILLRCYSRGGASPLSYQWAKLADSYGGGHLPSGTIQGRGPGDLLIRSLSEVHTGIYQCRVTNRVGYSVCQLNLNLATSKCHRGGGVGAGRALPGAGSWGATGRHRAPPGTDGCRGGSPLASTATATSGQPPSSATRASGTRSPARRCNPPPAPRPPPIRLRGGSGREPRAGSTAGTR
uniref:V-set and immunoglobulin domain containing 8 n=2 Tax=Neoaves TaxID=3078114 RepID=A0A8C8B5J7_9STRI